MYSCCSPWLACAHEIVETSAWEIEMSVVAVQVMAIAMLATAVISVFFIVCCFVFIAALLIAGRWNLWFSKSKAHLHTAVYCM